MTTMAQAEPLAQDYVIIDRVPSAETAPPPCPCDACAEKGGHLIIDDVALTRTPRGDLLATYTFNRDNCGTHPRRWDELRVQWSRNKKRVTQAQSAPHASSHADHGARKSLQTCSALYS